MDFLAVQTIRQFLDYRARGLLRNSCPPSNWCEFCGGPKQADLAGGMCNSCAARMRMWLDEEIKKREEEDARHFEHHMKEHHSDGSLCWPSKNEVMK